MLRGAARSRTKTTLQLLCGGRQELHMERLFVAMCSCKANDGCEHRWQSPARGHTRNCDLCEGQPALRCMNDGCGMNACRACAISRESVRAAVLQDHNYASDYVETSERATLERTRTRQPPRSAASSMQGRAQPPDAGRGGSSSGARRDRGRGRGGNPAFRRGPQP